MKTETEVAKENLFKTPKVDLVLEEHKETCQRLLEFLEEEMEKWNKVNEVTEIYFSTGELQEKIEDLQKAIKFYNNVGI